MNNNYYSYIYVQKFKQICFSLNKHDDDVLPTVKESITTIHSTPADETVTVRGKFEGLFGQRDEGEDMVVDVVGADVAVDDRGGTKVDSEGNCGIIPEELIANCGILLN